VSGAPTGRPTRRYVARRWNTELPGDHGEVANDRGGLFDGKLRKGKILLTNILDCGISHLGYAVFGLVLRNTEEEFWMKSTAELVIMLRSVFC
jgi:hypothetical protein